ncbi:hypothetical protein BS78_09G012700 [Paspalum vaginatum]|nr:hypothetical protein BS78_09G012700 [Paspalum vaginatum]
MNFMKMLVMENVGVDEVDSEGNTEPHWLLGGASSTEDPRKLRPIDVATSGTCTSLLALQMRCHKCAVSGDHSPFHQNCVMRSDQCKELLGDESDDFDNDLYNERPNINIETLDDYMAKYKDNRLHTVNLSTSAINSVSKISSVTFFGNHPAFVIRQIMISISTIHRNGDSYNGQFTVKDIFMVNGCIIEFSSFLFSYPFNKDSSSADYRRIREIIVALLNDELNNGCPIYFLEFLNLLFVCPFEELSNSEASIRFITNHPALSSYMERIRQLTILDNILERMQGNQRLILDQNLDEPYQWTNDVITVPLMKYVYEFDGRKNAPKGANKGVVPSKAATSINPEYTDKYMGCLCFARNFFSHANFQLILEEIDAAFAVQFSTFMHELFCLVVQDPNSSNNLDILKLMLVMREELALEVYYVRHLATTPYEQWW